MRPYLFMAGEFSVTMPLVFSRDDWSHTMNKTKLVITDGRLHRSNIPGEDLKGIIFFADQCQKELELENLNLLYWKEINCWPSARTLLQMTDRHAVLARAVKCGFVSHPVVQGAMEDKPRLPFPFVLKTGFDHRGEGKFLINYESEITASQL
jgi:hypothetical protein